MPENRERIEAFGGLAKLAPQSVNSTRGLQHGGLILEPRLEQIFYPLFFFRRHIQK